MSAATATAAARVTDRALPFARAFRAVAWAELALVFAQALLAGQFLGGADLVWLHGINAHVLQLLGLGHLVIGVLLWRPGRGPGWPALSALALLWLVSLQVGLGYIRQLDAHVPLGVALLGLLIALLAGTRHLSRATDPIDPIDPIDPRT